MNRRPNILFINLDQLRYDCLGFTSHLLVKTPHLDALAQSGMQFDAADIGQTKPRTAANKNQLG